MSVERHRECRWRHAVRSSKVTWSITRAYTWELRSRVEHEVICLQIVLFWINKSYFTGAIAKMYSLTLRGWHHGAIISVTVIKDNLVVTLSTILLSSFTICVPCVDILFYTVIRNITTLQTTNIYHWIFFIWHVLCLTLYSLHHCVI